jgi:hypothetical protein
LSDQSHVGGFQCRVECFAHSPVMPFAVLTIPSHHYDALRGDALTGDHAVVEHVGEWFGLGAVLIPTGSNVVHVEGR